MSRSSTEAEYFAMADTTLELRGLRDFLYDMSDSMVAPIFMHCDNNNAVAIASNLIFQDCTKYIEVNCHITPQEYEKRKITLPYVPSGV